jgi:Zn-dependent protease
MKEKEIIQIIVAIAILGLISGFVELINGDIKTFSIIMGAGAIIIAINILSKKTIASRLDADVEHEVWKMERFWFNPSDKLKKSVVAGAIIPLFITIVTLGSIKLMTILTYETRALKRRAARRFGPYSFTEMTDYHNALVGATGIISVLLITFITYWLPGDFWSIIGKMATFYAFFNMVPFSKLDGSQIYFGSRVLWSVLAVITLIFMMYAMLLI